MNKFWNFIRNEETGERELWLYGVIGDDSWYCGDITPTKFRQELNFCEGDIVVKINSEGGDVFAATAIYTMLKEYDGKITVKIDSLAASAASIVAMAGDVVEISPLGMIMIHNPSTFADGDSEELQAAAKMLDEVKETIINAYELKTKLPREQLAQMMDDETWIHAKKAVELGFADKIIGEENQPSDDSVAQDISTRRQVKNCIANAFKKNRNVKSKKKGVQVKDLRRELNAIIKEEKEWKRKNAKN